MHLKICAIFLILTVNLATSSDTGCQDSQKHFAQSCFAPTPSKDLDPKWVEANRPKDGWYLTAANDITRLHMTENLRGQNLTLSDNFDNSCFRLKLTNLEDGKLDVQIAGYDKLTFNWICSYSLDYPGVRLCEQKSEGPSEFHENLDVHFTYGDNKNLMIAAFCFPNGQVGWSTFSTTPTLTEEENKVVSEHIKSRGFSEDTSVVTFTDSCPNK